MTKHWALQDAKARLSELVRAAEKEPQIITYRGKPKVEVRAVNTEPSVKTKTLLDVLRAAPRVPEFKLPPRRREKPCKPDL
jgi:antitoxin (DNA-binding transcriptional repressor) of toxin-antitoxin stability system